MQTSTRLVPREIDKMITNGRIYKMKKLLGILVLGLVWCSTSNANHALNQTKETGGFGYWLVAGFLLLFVGFFIWIFWKKK